MASPIPFGRTTLDDLVRPYARFALDAKNATPADEEAVLRALRALGSHGGSSSDDCSGGSRKSNGSSGHSNCGGGSGGDGGSGSRRALPGSTATGRSGISLSGSTPHPSAGSAGGGCGSGSGSGSGAGLLRDEGPSPSGFGVRTCANPGCTNFTEACEADLRLERCGACLRVAYCGRKCQAAHWKAGHKGECSSRPAATLQREGQ